MVHARLLSLLLPVLFHLHVWLLPPDDGEHTEHYLELDGIEHHTGVLALGLPTEPVRPDALIKTYGMQSCH